MNLSYLLRRLNDTASGIQADNPEWAIEDVYQQAIISTFLALSEYDINPLHERILIAIDRMAAWNNSKAVTCPAIQIRFEQSSEPVKHWTLWSHASDLERFGLIYRPSGRNGGYKLTEEGRDWLRARALDIRDDAKRLLRDERFMELYFKQRSGS